MSAEPPSVIVATCNMHNIASCTLNATMQAVRGGQHAFAVRQRQHAAQQAACRIKRREDIKSATLPASAQLFSYAAYDLPNIKMCSTRRAIWRQIMT